MNKDFDRNIPTGKAKKWRRHRSPEVVAVVLASAFTGGVIMLSGHGMLAAVAAALSLALGLTMVRSWIRG